VRVLRVDAAVDEADDDAVTIQSFRAPQSAVRVEQPQETGTEIGRQRPDLVFPDVQHLGHVLELVRLRRGHLGRKAVEAVTIAVELPGVGCGTREERVLLCAELFGVSRDRGAGLVETRLRRLSHGRHGGGFVECRMKLGGRRRAQLHDIDLARIRVIDARELQSARDAGVAQRRIARCSGADSAEREEKTGKKRCQFHGRSGGRSFS